MFEHVSQHAKERPMSATRARSKKPTGIGWVFNEVMVILLALFALLVTIVVFVGGLVPGIFSIVFLRKRPYGWSSIPEMWQPFGAHLLYLGWLLRADPGIEEELDRERNPNRGYRPKPPTM